MSSLEVQKFAIKYDPPTFVIQYRNNETGKNFLKNIRLKIGRKADADKVTNKIISENADLLGPNKVSRDQIRDLIERIIGKLCQSSEKPPMKSTQSLRPVADEYGDLNKASDVSRHMISHHFGLSSTPKWLTS